MSCPAFCVCLEGGDDMAMLGQMSTHTYYHEPIEQYILKGFGYLCDDEDIVFSSSLIEL